MNNAMQTLFYAKDIRVDCAQKQNFDLSFSSSGPGQKGEWFSSCIGTKPVKENNSYCGDNTLFMKK